MKRSVILFVVILMLAGIASAETKLSMELWNRWTYHMTDGDVDENYMSLERGYFRLEPVFTPKIKGRFNLDFFSSDKDEDANGAGIKLKYAYLDMSILPIKDAKLTVGLMKNYFGTIYDWAYETIDKDPSDKYKFSSSTDYGVGVSGYLPSGYGTYAVGLYNGEGYKKTGDNIDINPAFLLDLRINPIVGLTLGGSYVMDTQAKSYEGDGVDIEEIESEEYDPVSETWITTLDTVYVHEMVDYDKIINKMAGVARITMIPNVDIRAQYLTRTETSKEWNGNAEEEKDKTITAVSIMPMINMKEWTGVDMELVFRYDMYDDDTDVDNDESGSGAYNTIIGGLNYHMMRDSKNSPKLWLQLNYSMHDNLGKDEAGEDLVDSSALQAQLRWKFSGTF